MGDRVPFFPRRYINLPSSISEEEMKKLNANLLDCWIQPPLNLLVVFFSPEVDFRVYETYDPDGTWRNRTPLHLRLKGWTLVDKDGLCTIGFWDRKICWYDSWY